MQKENVFLNHKTLLFLFFISLFAFAFYHVKYSLGLFFDMPAMFLGNISQDDTFSKFIIFPDRNIRYFTNVLISIPFNIQLLFLKNTTAINILRAFSLSYIIVHLSGLIINYLIALRTKRYDIASICFAFYTIFSIQNAIWICREVHISALFYFALLSYFLSRTKLGLKDLLPVLLLSAYLFESFEISMVLGIILFIFSILYTHKDRKENNRWYKVLIGFSGLLTALYIPIKTLVMAHLGEIDLNQGSNEWINASRMTIENLFSTNSLFCVLAIILIITSMLYKKEFNKVSITLISISFGLVFSYLKFFNYTPEPMMELQNYSFIFWFIFPIILLILIFDYKEIKISNKFVSNLIIISSICGITGLIWQINSCFEFNKYITHLKELLNKSENIIVYIPENDFKDKKFMNYNTCFGTMHKSIFLSEEYKINKIFIPDKYFPDYNEYCFAQYRNEHNHFDEKNQVLYLQTSPLRLKNKYWDISIIKNELEKTNN